MLYSKSIVAIPPGATIREQLEDRSMKQNEFALRMGLSEKHISRLINGQVELTHDVALRLECVLGVPASFWNNLEAIYREKVARLMIENDMDHDAEMVLKFPYAKMVALGWINAASSVEEKVINLRRYFEVAKLEFLDRLRIPGIVFRKTGITETSDYALAAWSQKAKIEARARKTDPINISKLNDSIPLIRRMTSLKPEAFCAELLSLMASCGIALVFLPHIDGSFLHGASFYDGKHIVMGLTVRGHDADKFWFSLFHELCHVILGHICESQECSSLEEEKADTFAKNVLIPQEKYDSFIQLNRLNKESIIEFADKIEIAPGIVLGRLQKEKLLPYNRYQELKEKYMISC